MPSCLRALFLSLFLATISTDSTAQNNPPPNGANFEYPNITLLYVDYLAPAANPDRKIPMVRDYDQSIQISGRAWEQGGSQTPVCFVSGTNVEVTAEFKGCEGMTWAKGDGEGNYDAPPRELQNGLYPATPMTTTLANGVIDFYEPFRMTWYVATKPDGPWKAVETSENPFYVTHKEPTPSVEAIGHFHSLYITTGVRTVKLNRILIFLLIKFIMESFQAGLSPERIIQLNLQ